MGRARHLTRLSSFLPDSLQAQSEQLMMKIAGRALIHSGRLSALLAGTGKKARPPSSLGADDDDQALRRTDKSVAWNTITGLLWTSCRKEP